MFCGGCGKTCSSRNAVTNCVASACNTTCKSGFSHCAVNGNISDTGCETSTVDDESNCGTCGHICQNSSAVGMNILLAVCKNSTCEASKCVTNFGNCNNNIATDGCETNLTSDNNNCGACANVCPMVNLTQAPGGLSHANSLQSKCILGLCTLDCIAPWADCDGNLTNGCEANIFTDTANCGKCGQACSGTGLNATCNAASPSVNNITNLTQVCNFTCAKGYKNCNNNMTDGCEASTDFDISNCGTCGTICTSNTTFPIGTWNTTVQSVSCTSGACVATCLTGFIPGNSTVRNTTNPYTCVNGTVVCPPP